MEIAIIEAENFSAVYFNGKMKYYNTSQFKLFPNLSARDILEKVMEHAKEFSVSPTIDNLEYFYLEYDEQFDTLDKADYGFPELLHEAITLYGLLE